MLKLAKFRANKRWHVMSIMFMSSNGEANKRGTLVCMELPFYLNFFLKHLNGLFWHLGINYHKFLKSIINFK